MKINIHIFDVQHGDAIIVEYSYENTSYWVVIDSKYVTRNNKKINPSYEFLKKKQVTKIDAVVITHLHRDHYTGIDDILYGFEIGKIIIPPFLSFKETIFKEQIAKLKQKIEELINRTSDPEIGKQADSLAKIIVYLVKNEDKWVGVTGPESPFRLAFSEAPLGRILLPLPKIKGELRQLIATGDFELDSFANMNDASIVLLLNIGNSAILLGADSTLNQWTEHRRQFNRDGVTCLNANLIKAPHHGSKHNNTKMIYDYLLSSSTDNSVFISANGKTHPHDEMFEIISSLNIKPYCTGLAKQCLAKNVRDISGLAKIPKEFRSFMSNFDIEDLPETCQGDITIEYDGISTTIYSSTGTTCIYRPFDTAPIKQLI